MMFFLLKRRLSWEETISISFAFAIYFVGFPLLVLTSGEAIGIIDHTGIFIFLLGSWLNTASEIQRHRFKQDETNRGKLF